MSFELSEQERVNLTVWLSKHNEECKFADPTKQGAIGGRITYCFTPTTVFTNVEVRCACGAEENITDSDAW